jgi:hypothetical protein
MTQIYFNIKNTIILAIFVFAFLFLPSSLFSQGAIVGYADGNKHVNSNNLSSFPSNAQFHIYNKTTLKRSVLWKITEAL